MKSNEIITVKPGLCFNRGILQAALNTPELVLFFGKLYDLDARQVTDLLRTLHNTDLANALFGEGVEHSNELQDYIVDLAAFLPEFEIGALKTTTDVPHGVLLPEVWKSLEVQIASSIKEVADTLCDVVSHMPGKEASMVFETLLAFNRQRPVLGVHRAAIQHGHQPDNLVVLDVSGSMSESTIRRIVEDVVAMSYMANAHLAIVSDTATWWRPGEYDVKAILEAAEYSGTHYEQLAPLMDMEWGVVVTIADYDSSYSAQAAIARCSGSIEQLLDISLVSCPTYLSEVLGQKAKSTRSLLVASDNYTLMRD